jgi:hypothetical protein
MEFPFSELNDIICPIKLGNILKAILQDNNTIPS